MFLRAAISLGAITMFSLGTAGAALAADEFTVVTKTVTSEDIDVDDDGEFSVGDQSIFSDDIVKKDDQKKDGKKDEEEKDEEIGTSGGVCIATRVDSDDDFEFECIVTYELPAGQITTQSLLDQDDFDEGEFTAAITGGTGIYKDASGEALIKVTDDGSEVTFRVDLNED
ncbi:MAG: allene oxide cyclase barrel-like domain-containing protein [Egibacteraceae bacterium]